MKIAIDLDGVLVNLDEAWCSIYNRKYVKTSSEMVYPKDITSWNVHLCMPKATEREVYDILNTPGLFFYAPPIKGSISGVNKLMAMGHQAYIITQAAARTAFSEKIDWLAVNLPRVPRENIIAVADGKAKALLANLFDVFIEDYPPNIEGAECTKIIITKPYNNSPEMHVKDAIYVNDWQDIMGLFSCKRGLIRVST